MVICGWIQANACGNNVVCCEADVMCGANESDDDSTCGRPTLQMPHGDMADLTRVSGLADLPWAGAVVVGGIQM